MKRSNRSTTDGIKREMPIRRISSKDCINSRAEYVVIATHEVVKRARLGGKEHSKARCRIILLHRSLAGPSTDRRTPEDIRRDVTTGRVLLTSSACLSSARP